MTIGRTRLSIIAGMLAVVLQASSAHAVTLSGVEYKCFQAIAKSTLNVVKGRLKIIQKCQNANLKAPGSCAAPDAVALGKLDTKLDATVDKDCGVLIPIQLQEMGYPGPCSDANLGDGFTVADLKACLKTSHADLIDQMIALEYDSSVALPLTGTPLKCQQEIAKNSANYAVAVVKNIQKCRLGVLNCKIDPNTLVVTCKINGIQGPNCATDDPKTAAALAKAKGKALTAIGTKCGDPDVVAVEACEPNQTTAPAAATCLVDGHTALTDVASTSSPFDLIDYEFARPGICGDNVVNGLNEECDGTDDDACPGQCGTPEVPDGFFACLCKTKPRVFVAEHSNADTDNGWNGLSTDGAVVEGGGYIVDLYDCDGFGNCNVGPSCSLPPHSPCAVASNAPLGTSSQSICTSLGQGTCRKERTATGPHCHQNILKRCNENGNDTLTCNGTADFCETTFHGAPVAQAAGGVAVCNVSTFSEDIVGTININTGDGSMKVRQRAVVYLPLSQDKPCPVCGGFCTAGSHERCTSDPECGANGPCILAPVCSDGERAGLPCRTTPPFSGDLPFFGRTSVDCLPGSGIGLITQSGGGLDINPTRKTSAVTMLPTFNCTAAGFTGKRCLGGTSEGRTCTVDSECPGGTCSPQCFCNNQPQPSVCQPACVGGGNDAGACSDDTDCPGGFCHPADCRVDPSDTGSDQEGICTSGPQIGHCSLTTYRGCLLNSDCTTPNCPVCQGGETCVQTNRACFVNSGIVRTGAPGIADRKTAGLYCVPANSNAINLSAGFPGPGALIQHEYLTIVP